MRDHLNEIARQLLCPLSKTLAVDPVLCEDGLVYEREAIEALRNESNRFSVPLISRSPFHSTLLRIIETLVSSGEINDEYLGGWADRRTSSESASFEPILEGAEKDDVELGEMYLNGDGVDRDEEKAYACFDRASEGGDEIGIVRKADCILTGMLGFEQSEVERLKWERHMREILPDTTGDTLEKKISALKGKLSTLAHPSPYPNIVEEGPPPVANEIDSDLVEEKNDEYEDSTVENEIDSDLIDFSTVSDTTQTASKHHMFHASFSTGVGSDNKVKECSECKMLKPQSDFTASQWKKNALLVKCRTCVCKLPAYQTPNEQQKVCCSCGISKTFESYSLNQWRKKQGEGRCCHCVRKGTLDHIPFSTL